MNVKLYYCVAKNKQMKGSMEYEHFQKETNE